MENRTLYGIDDGLAMNEDVGSWSSDKYRILQLYAHLFTKGMKGKWGALTYLDLYSGSGQSRVKGTGEILLGSPLIALSLDQQFDRYVFCETNDAKLSALKERVRQRFPNADVRFVKGDCNDPTFQLGDAIAPRALTLCFVDPYDLGVRFDTLRSLATARNIDFLCLLASRTDAGRNPHNYTKEENTKIEDFLGTTAWRERWDEIRKTSAREPNFGDFICEEFAKQMETLDYLSTPLHEMKPIRTDAGVLLYHLALFAKHKTAKKFWGEALKFSQAQRSLF